MRCHQCGATKAKHMPVEMMSNLFPERRREFCSWVCAANFMNSTDEWRKDPKMAIKIVDSYGGAPMGLKESK